MSPEDKAEILVAGWLATHQQEGIPNGLNQLKEIIADVIQQERDRKVRGGPFVHLPYLSANSCVVDLSRITMMEITGGGGHSQDREVELRWWFEDPTKRTGYEMSRAKAEEVMALWKERDRVPAVS